MAKIFVGTLPFAREEEMRAHQGIPKPEAGGWQVKRVFEGELAEGMPVSVLPEDLRQALDLGENAALGDYLKGNS